MSDGSDNASGRAAAGREERDLEAPPQAFLRPIALPVPLGYSGLLVGGGLLGAFHLGVLPVAEQHGVAVLLIAFVPIVQLTASVFAFLGRDTPVATEMGILAFAWLAAGITLLRDPPGATADSFGVFAVVAALALVSPIVATAHTRLVPAVVLVLAAVHLALAAAYYLSDAVAVERAAGALGWALAAGALYGSLAFQLEDGTGRQVLPILRRSPENTTLRGHRSPLDDVDRAPGVRKRF